MKPVIIVSTFPSKQSVTSIAKLLVKKKLVACVNITKISSVYTWEEKIENRDEYLALFKTTKKNQSILKKELKKLHPYDVPEIVEINPISMNKPYLKWLVDSTI
ncbi:MAG: divalent-cation tolerance protein CutA [Candidatus Nitrosopelagicus sp.]|nr:divalent-cation tolerance protein CutA [Candidatus Nitrosopelagicus sp.]